MEGGEAGETCSDLHSRFIILAAGRRTDCSDSGVEIRKPFRDDGRDREVVGEQYRDSRYVTKREWTGLVDELSMM